MTVLSAGLAFFGGSACVGGCVRTKPITNTRPEMKKGIERIGDTPQSDFPIWSAALYRRFF
jgi:hypothetical protein